MIAVACRYGSKHGRLLQSVGSRIITGMLRVLAWTGVALFAICSLLFMVFTAAVGLDVLFRDVEASDYTNVTIPIDPAAAAGALTRSRTARELLAYRVAPPGDGPAPAVLLLHEWWGLDENIQRVAERLAEEGYVVLAPDLWRGRTTRSIAGAIWQVSTANQARIDRDVDRFVASLRADPDVDGNRIAIVGFCFGGGQAIAHAVRDPAFSAAAVFYGNPVTDIERLEPLAGATRVLGVFGAEDRSISQGVVRGFDEALAAAGVEARIELFDGVGHAFVTDEAIAAGEQAPSRAWDLLIEFLDSALDASVVAEGRTEVRT